MLFTMGERYASAAKTCNEHTSNLFAVVAQVHGRFPYRMRWCYCIESFVVIGNVSNNVFIQFSAYL